MVECSAYVTCPSGFTAGPGLYVFKVNTFFVSSCISVQTSLPGQGRSTIQLLLLPTLWLQRPVRTVAGAPSILQGTGSVFHHVVLYLLTCDGKVGRLEHAYCSLHCLLHTEPEKEMMGFSVHACQPACQLCLPMSAAVITRLRACERGRCDRQLPGVMPPTWLHQLSTTP
jgi:hypothetical protein